MEGQESAASDTELPSLEILLVEDDELNRQVAVAFLERGGHRVSSARNGYEGVEAVRFGRFDVVLMDIRMPEMDGMEATRRIRAFDDRRLARIPIFALTANYAPAEVEKYLAAGLDGVITKPLRAGKLEEALLPLFGLPPAPVAEETPQETPILDPSRLAALSELLDPEVVTELKEAACASIAETGRELDGLWARGERQAIGKAAHRIAGVAANFGCVALMGAARRLEQECAAGGVPTGGEAINHLIGETLRVLSS